MLKGRYRTMNLSEPSVENVTYMIETIKEKLRMVNVDAMKPENFNATEYDDLVYLYEMVKKEIHSVQAKCKQLQLS